MAVGPDPFEIRVVIADDHAIVRSGLRAALEAPDALAGVRARVVAEASDGLAAIAAVKRHQPQLLLLDVAMPHAGGIEVLLEVRRWSPATRVVVFTGITATGLVADLIDAGVDGLFSKAADTAELFAKIPLILRGGRAVATPFVEALEAAPSSRGRLTDRERQTLNMIIAGRSNKEIAAGLGISIKTVDKHRTSLMQKLEVSSVAQLVARALKDGLIDPAREL